MLISPKLTFLTCRIAGYRRAGENKNEMINIKTRIHKMKFKNNSTVVSIPIGLCSPKTKPRFDKVD